MKPHLARFLCTRPCEGKTPYPQGTGRGLPLGARRHVAGLPPSLPSCDGAFVLSQLSDYLFGLAAAVAWSQSCQQSDHPFHVQPSLPCRCPASHSPLVDSPMHSPSAPCPVRWDCDPPGGLRHFGSRRSHSVGFFARLVRHRRTSRRSERECHDTRE